MAALALHGDVTVWLLRIICGTKMEVRGHEKLLPGPVIVAAKHQAAWDTFAIISLMRDPAMVMKAELLNWPIYGRFCRKFELIPIQRELGPAALRQMVREARSGRRKTGKSSFSRKAPGKSPGPPPTISRGLFSSIRT